MSDFPIESADAALVKDLWAAFSGLPIVTVNRNYDDPSQVDALVYRDEAGAVGGHVSFALDSETGEIVTIEATEQGRHIGGRLLDAAERDLRERGVKRIVDTTTNDNIRAQAFYMRRGYRLARIERDGME